MQSPSPIIAVLGVMAAVVAPFVTHFLTKRRELDKARVEPVEISPTARNKIAKYIRDNGSRRGWPNPDEIDDLFRRFPQSKKLQDEIAILSGAVVGARAWRNAACVLVVVVLAMYLFASLDLADDSIDPSLAGAATAASTTSTGTSGALLHSLRSEMNVGACEPYAATGVEEGQSCSPSEAGKASEFPEIYLLAYRTADVRRAADPRVVIADSKTLCVESKNFAGRWNKGGKKGIWVKYLDSDADGSTGRIWLQSDDNLGVVLIAGQWGGVLDGSWEKVDAMLAARGYELGVDLGVFPAQDRRNCR